MGLDLENLTNEELEQMASEKGMSVEDFKAQAEIEAEAEAQGKTVEELLEDRKETEGILKKYGEDPTALAKALKETQRGVTRKIEEELRSKRSLEDKVHTLEEQLGKLTSQQKEDVVEYLKKQYPDLDEQTLKIIHEISSMQTKYAMNTMQNFYANDRLEGEKLQFKDDELFSKYKDEIETRLNKLPVQFKLQRGIVKQVRDSVVGGHIEEILKENKGKSGGEHKDTKEILGMIKGSKPAAHSPGGKKSALSETQAAHAQQLGLTDKSYLSILKERKTIAKQNGKQEPELISDPVR